MGWYIVSHRSSRQLTSTSQSPPIQHLTFYQLFLGHRRAFPCLHTHKQCRLERLLLCEPTRLTSSLPWIHEKRASACGTQLSIRGCLPPPDIAIPPHAVCDTRREGSNWPWASTQSETSCRGRPRCDRERLVGVARTTYTSARVRKSGMGER